MAKKNQLTYKEIEDRLRILKDKQISADDIGYKILYAFGKPERELERYREGKGVIKTFDGLLVKGLFCYKSSTTIGFANELDNLKCDSQVLKAGPKIIAVSDGTTIRAYDTRQQQTFEQKVDRLYCDFEFFYPLAGIERIEYIEESPADIKAAEKLAKLHDEIRAYNEFTSDSDLHDLNTFIARLLFCFFAEDTGIFADNVFTSAIKKFTVDARNLKDVLEQIFRFMGNKPIPAGMLQTYCQQNFAYVGGGLFERSIYIPELSNKARQIIIDSGELDWQDINPDIFGSMIQAVVNPDVRANQGMHYTSVPNIMKVINPLFLDELRSDYNAIREEYDKIQKQKDMGVISLNQLYGSCKPLVKKCDQLMTRMSKMKFFDPACGSGNFLIITYKMMRLLEMDILDLKSKCSPDPIIQFIDGSCIRLQQFYGIELLDFPHEVAMLSLWLAEHQMNKKMHQDFGVNTNALPLQDITNIHCGNACRIDWKDVCPHSKTDNVYVFGNPPYLGSALQSDVQKQDMENIFSNVKGWPNLDYISCWFYLGANYIGSTNAKCAFVSTKSICQGEQVDLLWTPIFAKNMKIDFAYTGFKWTNNAKYNAAVICVIIGICYKENYKSAKLFTEKECSIGKNISPYLVLSESNLIIKKIRKPISNFPMMDYGSKPADGGNLILTSDEKDDLINNYPIAKRFVKQYMGADDFINGIIRYCIWINPDELDSARTIPFIKDRIDKVYKMRISSKKMATQKDAERSYQFAEPRYSQSECVIMPSVSSERRDYIPIGYLDDNTVVSNSAFSANNAPMWLFGILDTRIHMIWTKAVAGYLGTSIRYSNTLCYNTFPFPKITPQKKAEIEEAATDILLTREPHLTMGKTLADLYDPDTMPDDLLKAHQRLDDIVESCYPGYPFASDEARLECLFKMYEKMTKK